MSIFLLNGGIMTVFYRKCLLWVLFLSALTTTPLTPKTGQKSTTDWAGITTTYIQKKIRPRSIAELQHIVRGAAAAGHTIAVRGAGYSQGGQTAYTNGIVIDMRNLNAIIDIDKKAQTITVQAGATWEKILECIDPLDLSVSCMQSYYNFSVGGSLSVNVHGRDNAHSQIINTVESINMVLADGSLVTANRHENYDLFRAAIGGYGYAGVIAQVTLKLTRNCKLARIAQLIPLNEYKQFFFEHIHNNPDIVMHNGNLYTHDFKNVLSVAWKNTDLPLTTHERMQQSQSIYPLELIGLQIMRRVSKTLEWRAQLEPKFMKKTEVAWRNNVMAYDTKSLEPLINFPTSHILQEYFIPCDLFDKFVTHLSSIIKSYGVNLLNCSIRYVKKNTESLLSYASHDSFSFVLYINVLNTQSGKEYAHQWTQELIDAALMCKGSFYLPYMLSARHDQLFNAYPHFADFISVKKKYDPQGTFSNELFRKYVEKTIQ